MPALRLTGLGALAVVLLQCLGPPARAQVAASVSLDTDDLFRGVSLSDGRPVTSLALSYDHPSGAFSGVTVTAVDTRHSDIRTLGYSAYLGYARRLDDGASWEVGVTYSQTSVYLDRKYSDHYTEIYAGFSKNNLAAHIYYSPKYLGEDSGAVYADLDGAMEPAPDWRVFGHAGVLMSMGRAALNGGRTRFDLRTGVARQFKSCELHLAWTVSSRQPFYPEWRRQKRSTLDAGVAVYF